MALVLDTVVLLLVGLAAYTDLRARRIPNALTLPAACLGLAAHLLWRGPDGLGVAALGWLAGFGLLLLPFLLRGIGAGDVKLLAAVGALQGPQFALVTGVVGALVGGVLATVLLRRTGTLGIALHSLALLRFLPRPLGRVITAGRIPYAPAIALGALAALTLGVAA